MNDIPEVKWVDPDCLFQTRGLNTTVVPVMGLDAIEAWLTSYSVAMAEGSDLQIQAGYHAAISDLLAQVQAWKEAK